MIISAIPALINSLLYTLQVNNDHRFRPARSRMLVAALLLVKNFCLVEVGIKSLKGLLIVSFKKGIRFCRQVIIELGHPFF